MRLCQFYYSPDERRADLVRRMPVNARLGVLLKNGVVDITDLAARHGSIHAAECLGVLAACVAVGEDWAGLRAELAQMSSRSNLDPNTLFFGPCILRPAQFLDFYAFEQHVRTSRALRGFDFVAPEWYEVPVYYNANPTTLIGHGMTAYFPADEKRMDYECEMACVIGKAVRNATLATASEVIAGYTILNDFSARDRQMKAMPVNMGPAPGKDFCAALGPYLLTKDEIRDLAGLRMRAYVNDQQWTDGEFGTIRHSFEAMIVYASKSRWLYPGDVIGSGTVGGGCGLELGRFLKPGDIVRIEIDQLDALENRVQLDQQDQMNVY